MSKHRKTLVSPPNPYPLDEYAYRQYIAGLKPSDILGSTKQATGTAIALYLKKTYGMEFWVEDILYPECACYWTFDGSNHQQYDLPEWAQQEEILFQEELFGTSSITKALYDQKMMRVCEWCAKPVLVVDMVPLCLTVNPHSGMGEEYAWLCAVCMEPHRQAQALHDETQEERIATDGRDDD